MDEALLHRRSNAVISTTRQTSLPSKLLAGDKPAQKEAERSGDVIFRMPTPSAALPLPATATTSIQ